MCHHDRFTTNTILLEYHPCPVLLWDVFKFISPISLSLPPHLTRSGVKGGGWGGGGEGGDGWGVLQFILPITDNTPVLHPSLHSGVCLKLIPPLPRIKLCWTTQELLPMSIIPETGATSGSTAGKKQWLPHGRISRRPRNGSPVSGTSK